MRFYNRVTELKQIRTALKQKDKQFIVLYGRRRTGKSTLLQEVLPKDGVYHVASQLSSELQREELARSVAEKLPGFSAVRYPSWNVLLEAINERASGGGINCLVIDEFPYLVRKESALPSLLQRWLDQRSRLNVHLILCGSSQQMMGDLVLTQTAPLYGRADEIIKLGPLGAGWLQDHLPDLSPEALVTEFATWGGIPRYWQLRGRYDDHLIAIQQLMGQTTGVLYGEANRLLLDEVRDVTQPISILNVVAGGANRISEIGGRLQKSAASLSRPLNRLIELNYLTKERPYGSPHRKTKLTLYQVADPFLRFYYRFVLPNRTLIELDQGEVFVDRVQTALSQFVSQPWEQLCVEATARGALDKIYPGCGRWWGKNTDGQPMEIDFVGESLDGSELLVGECKWSDLDDPAPLRDRLIRKAALLPVYHGQKIRSVIAARSIARSDGYDTLTPASVLKTLRY